MNDTPTDMQNPFLVGQRLYLRPLEPNQDYHHVAQWHNEEKMRSYFNVYPTSDTRMKERLDQFYRSFQHILLGVALKENHALIGIVGLKDINILNQSAEFYVKIDPSMQGKGYGTEATTLMVHYGFMELNLNRIQTQDMEENIGGWRADEKAGFKLEGTLREAILRFGRYQHVRVYSILRDEFLQKQDTQDKRLLSAT
ncbi:GNAT family N-acetyltransferase [Ktedonobacter racemifer]|uniref:GCN5-related N-acetyltransferase n=1 Tax=Ktedonobacter racemifer DSM 44963 TaxID=485913 RepID=D6U6C1_KTERA|nr:GNAT family protein [Ktedonobacter racemifer]EFH80532.1 GCN5-related N-acetyltransferase [Ktedonobacter racemifer DSM 44963]